MMTFLLVLGVCILCGVTRWFVNKYLMIKPYNPIEIQFRSFEILNTDCPFATPLMDRDVEGKPEVIGSCCTLVMKKACSETICPLLKIYDERGEEGDY